MNVKSDFEMKNCPLCGSDKIAMIATTSGNVYGILYFTAEIECFSCGTRFLLRDKTKEEIINLWNGKRTGENA
jgi:DNA-directed RNA polymerase subunit RPC12/RpoP